MSPPTREINKGVNSLNVRALRFVWTSDRWSSRDIRAGILTRSPLQQRLEYRVRRVISPIVTIRRPYEFDRSFLIQQHSSTAIFTDSQWNLSSGWTMIAPLFYLESPMSAVGDK